MNKKTPAERAEVLDNAPMQYAPENELGVVFLFAHLARKWRLRIDNIRASYPDCIAYQKIKGKERQVRIEFEYKSKNFLNHGHNPKSCDWIVCWEHNWPDAPQFLQIVELRREFGLGFNVWIVPIGNLYKNVVADSLTTHGSVPSQAHKDDLILYYLTNPDRAIKYVYRLIERADKITAGWKPGKDYMARAKRICKLDAPIFLEDLQRHRILSTAGFVRGRLRGRPNVTEYWPYLYSLIIKRNPSLKSHLAKCAPDLFT